MKKLLFLAVVVFLFAFSATLSAQVQLFVDSAPNAYGSPNWAPWWSAAKTDVVAGTFTNMRTGTFPGTLLMDPYDEIVYSTMDLGKRLHWIYWVPGKTTSELDELFEVKWVIDWGGTNWTYDWNTYSWALDGPNAGWIQPGSWENYGGGVIGSFGFAWWAGDDEALPYDTDGNPWNETDQADIDALRDVVFTNQTFANGLTRIRSSVNDPWQYSNLQVNVVPEPGTFVLLGAGLLGIGIFGWRRKRNAKA